MLRALEPSHYGRDIAEMQSRQFNFQTALKDLQDKESIAAEHELTDV